FIVLPPPRPPLFPYRRSSDLRCGSQTPKESLMSTFRLLLTASPSSFRRLFRESLAEVTSVVVMLFTVSLGLMSQVAPTTKLSGEDRKSTRLNSSHVKISYAVF